MIFRSGCPVTISMTSSMAEKAFEKGQGLKKGRSLFPKSSCMSEDIEAHTICIVASWLMQQW